MYKMFYWERNNFISLIVRSVTLSKDRGKEMEDEGYYYTCQRINYFCSGLLCFNEIL